MESINAQALSVVPLPVESPSSLELPPQQFSGNVSGPSEGLAYFGEWLRSRYSMDGFFVYDNQGEVIFGDGEHERLQIMVRNLALVGNGSANHTGHVRMKIGSTSLLEVIPVETIVGRMVLGLIVEQPLNADDIGPLSTALQRAVAPPET